VSPKVGQWLLAGLLVLSIGLLVLSSVSAWQARATERRQIMSEESDAGAQIFVQRESFNTLLSIQDWALGEAQTRDVQIARALLGQRLTVVTSSGLTTWAQTTIQYQTALPKLDALIRQLSSAQDANRDAVIRSRQVFLDDFRNLVIKLNIRFQQLSRQQVLQVSEARAQSELQQSILLAIILLLGSLLSFWVSTDIRRAYLVTRARLSQERDRLEATRSRLVLMRNLESVSQQWLAQISEGLSADQAREQVSLDLAKLVASADQDEDIQLAQSRANEVLQVLANRELSEQALSYQKDFDAVTGLQNRTSFTRAMETAHSQAKDSGQALGILILDIDRFHDINSSLGYSAGDEVLNLVAQRLVAAIDGPEYAARLSADEFGVLLTGSGSEELVGAAIELVRHLSFRTSLAGQEAQISVSGGLSINQYSADSAADLSRSAAMAIYLAKAPGDRQGFVLYEANRHESMMNIWHEEIAVRNALRSGEFKVYFQPVVDLETGIAVGAEALVRWERPGVGLVMPGEFLPTVQRAGVTVELGWQIIEESLMGWTSTMGILVTDDFLPYVSVNLDLVQLLDPNLANFVISALQRNRVPAGALVLEVTEHAMVNQANALEQLRVLREQGIRIALDDFGSGYSNLGQAHQLPLDILKIDRSFLPEPALSHKSASLISDIKNIADSLGLAVVAEGVETQQVADALLTLGVRYVQGFLFSRAVPADQLAQWMGGRGV
jgi:diguanylate cyclase (GGDEF)-like protein